MEILSLDVADTFSLPVYFDNLIFVEHGTVVLPKETGYAGHSLFYRSILSPVLFLCSHYIQNKQA